jgi:hypothetical protein
MPPAKLWPQVGRSARLLVAFLAINSFGSLFAQTVFTANGLAGSANGASTSVAAAGLLYNVTGPTSENIQGVTFGNNFTMTGTGPDSGFYDNSFIIGGGLSGDTITAGTTIGFSYNFTLAKNAMIPGDATWTLRFSDSVNNPSGSVGTSSVVASGVLNTASDTFVGNGTYNFISGVNATDTFRAFFQVTYNGALAVGPPVITGTMSNTGFGGEGITISAVPEPSTYAALAGVGVLLVAATRRRRTASVLPA